jgi:hypothetical protein
MRQCTPGSRHWRLGLATSTLSLLGSVSSEDRDLVSFLLDRRLDSDSIVRRAILRECLVLNVTLVGHWLNFYPALPAFTRTDDVAYQLTSTAHLGEPRLCLRECVERQSIRTRDAEVVTLEYQARRSLTAKTIMPRCQTGNSSGREPSIGHLAGSISPGSILKVEMSLCLLLPSTSVLLCKYLARALAAAFIRKRQTVTRL